MDEQYITQTEAKRYESRRCNEALNRYKGAPGFVTQESQHRVLVFVVYMFGTAGSSNIKQSASTAHMHL